MGEDKTGTETAIDEARRDLENAVFPHFGLVMDPLRRFVAGPLLGIEAAILPPIAKAIPPLDPVIRFGLKFPFDVARDVYHFSHTVPPKVAHEVRFQFSQARSTTGFILHTTYEFLRGPARNMKVWEEFTNSLTKYCKSVGIEDELLKPILSEHLNVAIALIGAVMKSNDTTEIRRRRTSLIGRPPRIPNVTVVAKMMRYSCAAYGRPMMKAYDILVDRYTVDQQLTFDQWEGGEDLKSQVADHVGIPVDCITHFYLGAGGDLSDLKYYISVDHDLHAVVLVIRGTFSISQWHIDFQGQSRPFCGGEAHKGIADLAEAIVKQARAELIAGLEQNPTYRLMVTGQSLGGGLSPLVNILLHVDPDIGKRAIECHAFAGPPVYYSDATPPAVAKAISNCTHYIHGDDVVPYLSLHQVRRFNAKLTAMEELVGKMGRDMALRVSTGRQDPTPEMVSVAFYGDDGVRTIAGGPNLIMPASENVWFLLDEETQKVSFAVCDPQVFSRLGLHLCGGSSLNDHAPQVYEYVLDKAEKSGWQFKP